jgi:hypothetical protein
MSDFDDDDHAEYSTTMTEYGFDEMPHEEGMEAAVDELLNEIESLPTKMQQLFDYLMQGYDLADAAYYAGYGNGTEGLHKVLKKDTGQNVKEKLGSVKQAHGAGKERAVAKKAERAEA